MNAAVAVTVLLSLGYVTASPFGSIVAESASASSSASSSASYCSSSSSSSSFSYYSTDVCTAVGYNIRDYLPTLLFDQIEQQFLEKKCELLNAYGVYPRDIGALFDELTPECLNYDIIIVGSGPAGLSAIPTLAALGKRILVVEKGYYAPPTCDSLYYRSSLYESEYVNAYQAYVNGVDITKNIYTCNLLGALCMLDSNTWNIGCKSLYDQLAQLSPEFAWEKVYQRYQALECYKSYSSSSQSVSVSSSTTTTSSSSSSSSVGSSSSSASSTTTSKSTYTYSTTGSYLISNSYRETYLSRTILSLFQELGYCSNDSPFDQTPGFTILPILSDNERPTLFPYTIFSSLSDTSNIDLALGTTVDQILFNGCRASGVQVTTPSGQTLVITANDQVILSTGPISTYQLLFKSGCGPNDLLNQFNIAPQFPIPSLGQQLIFSPIYNGLCLKFPKGFIQDYDSDARNLAYIFGDYGLSATTELEYYRAYLAVGGSNDANVALKFQAYTSSTSQLLRSRLNYQYQFDSFSIEYVTSLINEYDLIFINIQLLNPQSRGSICYRDSIDTPYIDSGLFTEDYDVQCLLEAIQQTQAIAKTQIFSQYNCEIIQIPVNNFNGDFFTEEFNRQSLYYHTSFALHASGGFSIGSDYQTAVVDQAFRVLGTENLRLFSPCVIPYPLSSDSIAISTYIGYFGAEVISNEYNNIFLDTISISNTDISSSSSSIQSSSYSSRDVDVSSSSFTSTDINQNGLTGSLSSTDINSSSYSAESTDINSSSYSASSTDINSGSYSAGSTDINSSSYSASSTDIDTNSYSSSSSNFDVDSCGDSLLSGSSGAISTSSSEFEASQSSYESNQYSSNSNNFSSSNGSGSSLSSAQYSAESQSYAVESESASYSSTNTSSIGAGSAVSQSSQYAESEYQASSKVAASATNISGGSGSIIDC